MIGPEGWVFWQNALSLHQAPLIRELSKTSARAVAVIAESGISRQRRVQGWEDPDYGLAEVVVAPDDICRRILEERFAACAHVFSGLTAYPRTADSLRKIAARPHGPVGVFVEPWDPDGWRGGIRAIKYKVVVARFRKHIDFVLTTGSLGREQYTRAGFNPNCIVDFGYGIDAPDSGREGEHQEPRDDERAGLRIIFVGTVRPLKRVGDLISALSLLRHRDWVLDVVGAGTALGECRKAAREGGIADRITWHGYLPNDETRRAIGAADLLVLPSRYDGWGAVVSEAVLSGTRVVVSDRCGAAATIGPADGCVYRAGRVDELGAAVERMLDAGPVAGDERATRSRRAAARVSAAAMSQHLMAAVHGIRSGDTVVAPWLQPPEYRGLR